MRKIVALFLFLFTISVSDAQTELDSLRQVLEQSPEKSTQRVDVLNKLGFENWIIDSKKSIDYGEQALVLAKKLEYNPGEAMANRVIGVAHWTRGQPRQALANLTKAQSIFESDDNLEGVANCILNIGMVYAQIEEYEKALDLYDKAINIFTKLNLDGRIATAYAKIATVFIAQERFYDANTYLNNALTIHEKNDFVYGKSEVHNKLGTMLIEQGDLDQAEHHIRKALGYVRQTNDADGMISNIVQFGKLLRLKEDFYNAEIHLELAVSRAAKKDLKRYRLEAYHELKLLKEQQGELSLALSYSDAYLALKDSVYDTDKSRKIAALEFSRKLERKNEELEYLRKKKESNRLILIVLVVGILLILVLSILFIKNLRSKNRQQRELINSNRAVADKNLENQRLRQAELEQQLHFKNKELASYALNFVQKKEMLGSVEEQVKAAKHAKGREATKIVANLHSEIQQQQHYDREWENFKRLFESVHANFDAKIKGRYGDITSSELKLCKLIRLNLNIKESAAVLGISPESVKTARYRLRKKMDLSSDEDLFDHLIEISGP